jgi:hypothetical protein
MRRFSRVWVFGALASARACPSDSPVFSVQPDAFSDGSGASPDGVDPDEGDTLTSAEICDDNDNDDQTNCDDSDCAEQLACRGVCGDDTMDDGQECDGSADPCSPGFECSDGWLCGGPPISDAFPSNPLAGPIPALVLHPQRTNGF